jgi:hypothetical protein
MPAIAIKQLIQTIGVEEKGSGRLRKAVIRLVALAAPLKKVPIANPAC